MASGTQKGSRRSTRSLTLDQAAAPGEVRDPSLRFCSGDQVQVWLQAWREKQMISSLSFSAPNESNKNKIIGR